jgi:hypothetical protein
MTKRDEEIVTIAVRQEQREEVARRRLDAAADTPEVVATTSDGFAAPAWVIDGAGLDVAQPAQATAGESGDANAPKAGEAKGEAKGKTSKADK